MSLTHEWNETCQCERCICVREKRDEAAKTPIEISANSVGTIPTREELFRVWCFHARYRQLKYEDDPTRRFIRALNLSTLEPIDPAAIDRWESMAWKDDEDDPINRPSRPSQDELNVQ